MRSLRRAAGNIYRSILSTCETCRFDRYRRQYSSFSFTDKKKMAAKWLAKYPDQAHFDFEMVKLLIEKHLTRPVRIIEAGGWRGDLACKALSSFSEIEY